MLSALVTEEEADRFCEEQGLKKENFCHVEKVGPNEGELVITMPCRRLLGKPAAYVHCRAYGGFRPAVCGSYLCRVAVQYKAGFLELDEALQDINRAFCTGNVTYFNWVQTDDEGQLLRASMIPHLLDAARLAHADLENPTLSLEDVENVFVAEAFTPVFVPASSVEHLKLNMLFDIFDRGELELKDLIGESRIALLGPGEEELAKAVALTVVQRFRSLFTKEDDTLKKEDS